VRIASGHNFSSSKMYRSAKLSAPALRVFSEVRRMLTCFEALAISSNKRMLSECSGVQSSTTIIRDRGFQCVRSRTRRSVRALGMYVGIITHTEMRSAGTLRGSALLGKKKCRASNGTAFSFLCDTSKLPVIAMWPYRFPYRRIETNICKPTRTYFDLHDSKLLIKC